MHGKKKVEYNSLCSEHQHIIPHIAPKNSLKVCLVKQINR